MDGIFATSFGIECWLFIFKTAPNWKKTIAKFEGEMQIQVLLGVVFWVAIIFYMK